MFTSTRIAKVAGLAAALTLPLTFAACGTSSEAAPAAGAPSSAAAPSMSASSSPMSTPSMSASTGSDQPFGTACSAVPCARSTPPCSSTTTTRSGAPFRARCGAAA